MSASENKAAIQAVFDKLAVDPMQVFTALTELCHPDVETLEAPGFSYGGTYRGVDGLIQAMLMASAQMTDMSKARVEEIVADGDHVIVRMRVPWELPPEPAGEALVSEWYTFRGGKIARIEPFFWDLYGRA
ncbi:nuclear transport factor 2 family protein [Mycobacterium sp. NAZ190054]|uniref:nuclear transport factor 2 family protein n=1 Tax=Mycobacterium sp. NAZ190054 TaxID=1747766 RepID=UPI000796B3B6|nr:nuclear transport factor 2 family protein [Mycobacterium sp. NAZ190054]KWX57766.1 hypothetical protein ASJ79_10490 [Mycobacterium sp. NAZ190054]